MHIGLTYDLKEDYRLLGYTEEQLAEFDSKETIDALDAALSDQGAFVERIGNAQALIRRLAQGASWDLVFNVAEGLFGAARESQVPAILDVYQIPYTFSDPSVLAICLDKAQAKLQAAQAGIPTPTFRVVRSAGDVALVDLAVPLFVKPLSEGTSRGITAASIIRSYEQLEAECVRLLDVYRQPVLVEEYLPGREFTVGIVGTAERAFALGALEVLLTQAADPGVYSYDNKQHFEGRVSYRLAEDAVATQAMDVALGAYRALGCRDAGRVDIRVDALGQPSFIEVNPLAGLHPRISDLSILCREIGLPYSELIGRIVASARLRDPEAPVSTRMSGFTQ
jgi:D-alanine-D-alanine ligase